METNAAGATPTLPDHLQAPCLHAGFWMRFAAYLIDSLVLMPVLLVLEFFLILPPIIAQRGQGNPGQFLGAYLLAWLVMGAVWWVYYALFESSTLQATPGKLALALRVTDLQGRRLGFGRASGRFFGKIVSRLILDIGYMMAGWTERKQALHDMMAGTCVVRRDWLLLWEKNGLDDSVPVPSKTPTWAVVLIVVGVLFCVLTPIVAILAAIAIPAYQDYVIRSQVMEGVTMAVPAEPAIKEYADNHNGMLPADNMAAGLASSASINGNYVSAVQVENGEIIAIFGKRANMHIAGKHVVLHPDYRSGQLYWSCRSDDIDNKYLPPKCRQ